MEHQFADGMLSPIQWVHIELNKHRDAYSYHYRNTMNEGLPWTSVVFHWWSKSQTYSPATTAQRLLGSWRKQHSFVPICLLGTITRDVLILYIQLEANIDSIPAVTSWADTTPIHSSVPSFTRYGSWRISETVTMHLCRCYCWLQSCLASASW